MINRGNWQLIKAFLRYRQEVDQISRSSMRLEETWLRHLLEWADCKPFDKAPNIRPTFPEYVLTARQDGLEKPLSPIYVSKVIRAGYRFFDWVRKHKRGFSSITAAWLDTLKPTRMTIELKEHEAVTLEEILAIARAPVYSLRDRRIRAAAVFWFLSGIRIGAFVSMPVSAVDLDNLAVYQFPKLGVRTKNKKHATTYLLNIPELLEVVNDWDREVRRGNPGGLWFANLATETEDILSGSFRAGEHRHTRARKDLTDWLARVGLPYHSPHKFRHGHAVYAIKNANDIQALKAVSQNLMHANLSITDGVYGVLSEKDVKNQILSLGEKNTSENVQDLAEQVRALEVSISNLKKIMGV
jgi:integrase